MEAQADPAPLVPYRFTLARAEEGVWIFRNSMADRAAEAGPWADHCSSISSTF